MKVLVVLFSLLVVAMAQKVVVPIMTMPNAPISYYIKEGHNKTLNCHAEGSSDMLSYKWKVSGRTVKTSKNVTFDSKTGELVIIYYRGMYSGDYVCFATINDGTSVASAMSPTQKLILARLDDFNLKGDPYPDKVVSEYDYTKLECRDQGLIILHENDLKRNWYDTDSQLDKDEDRLFVDAEGDLHFTYVKRTDTKMSSENDYYRCSYASNMLNQIKTGKNNLLSVREVNNPSGIAPQFMYSNNNTQGILGSSASLQCFFSGYDLKTDDHLPTIKWFEDNKKEIKNGEKFEISNKNRILTIKNLEESDDKNYFCQGFTSGGNSPTMPVHLNVTSRPLWVTPLKRQTLPEKSNAIFHCEARSMSDEHPPEKPVWFINGVQADQSFDHNHFVFSADAKMLTIKNLKKPDDIRCLQCKVSNSIGTLMGDTCLNVVTPIRILNQPPLEQEIEHGDLILLTVKAVADEDISSSLSYDWTFANKTYKLPSYPPHVEYDPKQDLHFINTSRLAKEEYNHVAGVYSCLVYNLYDSKVITTEVKLRDVIPPIIVKEDPAVPVVQSAGIDMWIIGLVIGIIFLIIVIAIIIFVICRKQQEGDYNVDKKETGAGLDPEKELRDKGFNDLSRPDYDDYDYPEKKPRGDLEYDDVPIGGDDESLGEYGDEEDTHFNEDGSFIGIYQKKGNDRHYKTESTF